MHYRTTTLFRSVGGAVRDHLCAPFLYPDYQSQNIRVVHLTPGDTESNAFESIVTRTILDAFWSWASRTTKGHLSELLFILRHAGMLRITNPLPWLGPYPRGHHRGALQAMMVIMRTLGWGGSRGKAKFLTARKARATYTVIWDASPEAGADIVLSTSSTKGQYAAVCNPSEGRWHEHFSRGCCARMGDIPKQDRAYSAEVVQILLPGLFV